MQNLNSQNEISEIIERYDRALNKAQFIYVAALTLIYTMLIPNIVYLFQIRINHGDTVRALESLSNLSYEVLVGLIIGCLATTIATVVFYSFPSVIHKSILHKIMFCFGTITSTLVMLSCFFCFILKSLT